MKIAYFLTKTEFFSTSCGFLLEEGEGPQGTAPFPALTPSQVYVSPEGQVLILLHGGTGLTAPQMPTLALCFVCFLLFSGAAAFTAHLKLSQLEFWSP